MLVTVSYKKGVAEIRSARKWLDLRGRAAWDREPKKIHLDVRLNPR
jgi:hypothetical protein